MQQLVIKNGFVIATHPPEIRLIGKYPDCEIVLWDDGSVNVTDIEDQPIPDPRTAAEKLDTYRDQRRMAYPSVQEQLDMMYHDQVDGTTTWMEMIQEIRGRYPKPAPAIL